MLAAKQESSTRLPVVEPRYPARTMANSTPAFFTRSQSISPFHLDTSMPTLELAVEVWSCEISVASASAMASATSVSSAATSISASVRSRREMSSMATYSTLSFTRTFVPFSGIRYPSMGISST